MTIICSNEPGVSKTPHQIFDFFGERKLLVACVSWTMEIHPRTPAIIRFLATCKAAFPLLLKALHPRPLICTRQARLGVSGS